MSRATRSARRGKVLAWALIGGGLALFAGAVEVWRLDFPLGAAWGIAAVATLEVVAGVVLLSRATD